ncbi:hypothetical protein [Streptococcus agalactiae]|uniref:hypothetical protein n=1 Tax=Streptococcus agalactiae TaxID=1311 RepID=UPI003628DAFD
MNETTQFERSKIAYINKDNKSVPVQNSGIIKPEEKGGAIMSHNTYSKSEIDLKFENLETKVDSKFEQLSQKIDFSVQQILSETKNLLLEQQVKEKNERENERKSTNRWLIGIAISLAGLIISIIVNFFLRK